MKKTVGLIEKVKIYGKNKGVEVYALFDTGATRTSIDVDIAKKLGLEKKGKTTIKSKTNIKGGVVEREVVECVVEVLNKKIRLDKCNVANRKNMSTLVLIGRDVILGNFVVDIEKTHEGINPKDMREKKDLKEIRYFNI